METYIYVLIEIEQSPMSYSGDPIETTIAAYEDEKTAEKALLVYEEGGKKHPYKDLDYRIDKVRLIK